MTTTATHALDLVTSEEITLAATITRADPRYEEGSVFVHVRLREPEKGAVAAESSVDRELEVLLVPPGGRLEAIEVVVSVTSGDVRSWHVNAGMRPALLFGEAFQAILGVTEHPDWQAALRRRGIPEDAIVQIDPWPAGSFGVAHEEGRRISRCIAYLRESDADNGYARPIEGLLAFFDNGAGEVLEVVDFGVVPLPPERGSYFPDEVGPARTDIKPLEITQPDGPSYVVDGNHVRWGPWSFRVGFDPYEGLVLHTLAFHDGDGDRARSVLHRASVCEMVVPYGDPGPMHGWKNAFDAGEWGLGRSTNSLHQGCDCLGVIHYFDVVLATEQGKPYTVERAVCLHEEDYGILWKHVDQRGRTDETRRSRRLVVSFVATVGNYEYGFYWYLYLDGNVQLEVKLTGIVSAMAIVPGDQPEFANVIAPGVAAAHHQHLFCARLDLDVDGVENTVYEVEAEPVAPGPDNPWGNAFAQKATRLESELRARTRGEPGDEPGVEGDEPRAHQPARAAGGLQAGADDVDTDDAGVTRLERRPARRVRAAQRVGHALPRRRAPRRGRVPQPARGRRWAPPLDRRRPSDRRHRRRPLVLLRRHPLRAPRGLAGHAGRVHGLPPPAHRLLRPQPRAPRAVADVGADSLHRSVRSALHFAQ